MQQAAHNKKELITLYSQQVTAVAARAAAGENVRHELEEIIDNAEAEFTKSKGVDAASSLHALADHLGDLAKSARRSQPQIAEEFEAARQLALERTETKRR